MKFILFSILTILVHKSFAQGPVAPCILEAANAARLEAQSDYSNHLLEDFGPYISYQDANEVVWQIQFHDLSTDQLFQYQAAVARGSCRVLEVRPSTPAVSMPPDSSERAKKCRLQAQSGCEYSVCMGTHHGMCK